ncbi:Zn-dependent hydrolase [Flexibacterium corallicola]|uniref:Zn-dependent hydrolase n=1 Tax=Flexibacterium corallicola TaxID=3037259 RepID=UPI00286EE17B|nr:Zn-dependent hydrolase [Pseudovibrio sp. M1P-2-3]
MAGIGTNHRINGDRLWQSLMDMAQIGPGVRGGNNRQTLTDEDKQGRDLFAKWCDDLGLTLTVDTMGNMFARKEGTDPSLDPVMIGSHLDTQPTGGKYDGVLGVLAGLEVMRSIHDQGIKTKRPIEIVNWTNEEGTRFAPAMLSSGVFAGVHSQEWAYARQDSQGKTVGNELSRIGYKGELTCGARKLHAMYELHIEQGPILEQEDCQIGVVTHGQGLRWLQITLTGKESHTGSTPMPMRVNAGLGAAQLTNLVNDIALRYAPLAVGAVGQMNVYPNSRNIIPGKAIFTVDFRHPEKDVITAMEQALRFEGQKIVDDLKLSMEIECVGAFDPVKFDEGCVEKVRLAAERLCYKHRNIVSGAGHDACWINQVAPTSMIMCPCVDGLSHNEDEEISPEWAEAGANVLYQAVLETAEMDETVSFETT